MQTPLQIFNTVQNQTKVSQPANKVKNRFIGAYQKEGGRKGPKNRFSNKYEPFGQ